MGQKINFTDDYRELEALVHDFESRDIDLEKDMPKFQQGLKLAARLQKRLTELENKVTEVEHAFGVEDIDE